MTVSLGRGSSRARPRFAWWPVVKTSASSVPNQSASSLLELDVQVDRAVEEA